MGKGLKFLGNYMKLSHHVLHLALISISINIFANNKVVYGVDNRFEVINSPYSSYSRSIAAMINVSTHNSYQYGDDTVYSGFSDLKSYRGFPTCSDMKFREQTSAAKCTGFLVKKDILITAGHCVVKYGQRIYNSSNSKCSSYKWVFDYTSENSGSGSLLVNKNNISTCQEIIHAQYDSELDYAIIRLNPNNSRVPLKMNLDGDTDNKNQRVMIIGHPTGLPMKVSAGASITSSTANTFTSNLDSFAGNSGSPVFDSYGHVIGILNSGEIDYFYNAKYGCYEVNVCDKVNGKCKKSSYGNNALGERSTKLSAIKYKLRTYLK